MRPRYGKKHRLLLRAAGQKPEQHRR
jgi:ferredoxin